jgi:uncharacterized protein
MGQQELHSLLQFPCAFPIKIMGEKDADLVKIVKDTLVEEKIDLNKAEFEERESSGGKYLSITVIFTAESREQLDKLYQRLTKIPQIKMVL